MERIALVNRSCRTAPVRPALRIDRSDDGEPTGWEMFDRNTGHPLILDGGDWIRGWEEDHGSVIPLADGDDEGASINRHLAFDFDARITAGGEFAHEGDVALMLDGEDDPGLTVIIDPGEVRGGDLLVTVSGDAHHVIGLADGRPECLLVTDGGRIAAGRFDHAVRMPLLPDHEGLWADAHNTLWRVDPLGLARAILPSDEARARRDPMAGGINGLAALAPFVRVEAVILRETTR